MILRAFKNALLTTCLAVMIIGPILSLVLNGFGIEFKLGRTAILAAVVFTGRLIYLNHWFPTIPHWSKPQVKQLHGQLGWWAVCLLGVLVPLVLSKYWISVAIMCLIYVLLGLGLNIVVGLAGLLNLGFVAFYAIGAYGYALGTEYLHFSFWLALPFCALLSGFMGAVLAFPVLRMHGDYLAIVTLGFGEIVRLLLLNWETLTGGPNGVSAPSPTFFGLSLTRHAPPGEKTFHEFFNIPYDNSDRYIFIYLILLVVVLLIYRLVTRLQTLPLGRAWEALREDEIASRSLGINHVTTKLSAFSLGALIGGVAGVFFAAFQNFVNPTSFTFAESALILAIVVLGGMGSALGVVIAAILLTLLPEVFRDFSDYRMFVFGITLVLMMIWRPQGLIKIARKWIAPPKEKANAD